jgi:hypothetical protein
MVLNSVKKGKGLVHGAENGGWQRRQGAGATGDSDSNSDSSEH